MASTSRRDAEAGRPTLQSSQAEVWYLKQIIFRGHQYPIITQNFNGPCSFIAICNILILRGDIQILPRTRQTVSYEFLSQLVAEYLLSSSPGIDISAALSIMPYTQKGMDLNPLFTSATTFRPSSLFPSSSTGAGGELALFLLTGIPLVHGWLVESGSPAARAMLEESTEDYDSAVSLIAEADHLAGGMLVQVDDMIGEGEAGPSNGNGGRNGRHKKNGKGPGGSWTGEERRKIHNALVIRAFLDSTSSQLTYHGLFHLASTLPSGELVALFRSSHLSVLYKDGENLVLDGDTYEYGGDDGLDYIDPQPEQAIQKTPTVALQELPVEPPDPDPDASLAIQQQHDTLEPQLEPAQLDPHADPSASTSNSTSTSTSKSASQPPLPGVYPISNPQPSNTESTSQPRPVSSPSSSQPQLQVPGTYTSQPLLPLSSSQPQPESLPDSGANSGSAVQPAELIVSSTLSSESESTYSPSPPVSASVAVSPPEILSAPEIAPAPAAAPASPHGVLSASETASASEPELEPKVLPTPARVPESLPEASHSLSHSHSPSPPPSQSPPSPHQQPPASPNHPQDQPKDRPPSPLTQLQRLGHSPTQIQQAPSQSTSRTTTTSRTAVTRTTHTSGAEPRGGSALYTLVTDQVFLHEPSVVWERIEDVDGADGMFVDGWFVRSSPAGGDFAGRTAEDTARDIQEAERQAAAAAAAAASGVDPMSDHELARQLQAEEDHYHFSQLEQQQRVRDEHQELVEQQQREERERRRWRSDSEEVRRQRGAVIMRRAEREGQAGEAGTGLGKRKEKKECVIM